MSVSMLDIPLPASSTAVITDVLARHPNAPATQNFLNRCKQWSNHWFAGHRPPMRPGCNNPPPRPNPCNSRPPVRPIDGLKDFQNPQYISIEKLRDLAKWPTGDPVHGRLALIAQEVLKRSDVRDGMDGGDRWGKDGWIHIDTLRQMSPTNPRR